MKSAFGIPYLGMWFLGLAFGSSIQARADHLLDFTMFTPPPTAQRKIAEPVVSWQVRADPRAYCEQAQPKDGMAVRPEGCVVWQRHASACTIVTTERTTHSQLGHLFLLCMKAE